jgi:hypothetical protein
MIRSRSIACGACHTPLITRASECIRRRNNVEKPMCQDYYADGCDHRYRDRPSRLVDGRAAERCDPAHLAIVTDLHNKYNP